MATIPALREDNPAVDDDALVEDALAAKELAEAAEAEAGSPHRWRMADSYADLSARGWSTRKIGKACGVSNFTVSVYVRCALGNPNSANRPRFVDAYYDVTGENIHFSSESDEWETPQDLFDELAVEFGFTLDVCATADNAKCKRFFTAADDALNKPWRGVCWMNPPYSTISDWMAKAWESAEAGATVVCLIPARVGSGHWWDYGRHGEIRFLKGRLKFGDGANSAPFDSAVVVFPRKPRVVWWER